MRIELIQGGFVETIKMLQLFKANTPVRTRMSMMMPTTRPMTKGMAQPYTGHEFEKSRRIVGYARGCKSGGPEHRGGRGDQRDRRASP